MKSSSINPVFSNDYRTLYCKLFTALSDAFFSQSQKSVDINIGRGMVTIALASLLIGGTILGKAEFCKSCGMVLGSFVFPTGLYGGFKIQYAGIYAENWYLL